MAKTVTVLSTDDVDGSPGAQTLTFAYQSQQFEIDLTEKNRVAFLASLQPFISAAHVVSGRQRPRGTTGNRRPGSTFSVDQAAVRSWAGKQGIQVAGRGRISAEVLEKFAAAHEH